ncbi:hypothetical protein [Chryseobacterium sp. EO14]|uniref:hypothetical protein n=1 Tax=Chryseobacterium sp. EO14 TaxID=2950551 RepID=UPI0021096FE3|nr:hypothetical protein [Chryseobacterium sp. EO14]MCQ4139540.1 hypothetical protein [Chryseobacterium sp. EO14]
MKISTNPTEYLLIKTMTINEWDDCNFAIININKDWKQNQKRRPETGKTVESSYDLKWQNYADTNAEFLKFSEEKYPEVKEWFSEKNQVFIELEKERVLKISLYPIIICIVTKCRFLKTETPFTTYSENTQAKNFGQKNFHYPN